MKNRFIRVACVLAAALLIGIGTVKADANAPRDTYIKEEYVAICEDVGQKYGICPELLESIIEAESSGNPRAYNSTYGCKGLCQIYGAVHIKRMKRLGVTDLYDPRQNITMAADILEELFIRYEDPMTVCMAYNGTAGPEEKAASGEFTKYARKVMARTRELERVHGK